jgi:hypothetical protein
MGPPPGAWLAKPLDDALLSTTPLIEQEPSVKEIELRRPVIRRGGEA